MQAMLPTGMWVRTHIPVGSIACIMLEPGYPRLPPGRRFGRARRHPVGVWVGEAWVRLYASGQPGGAHSDRLLYQAKLALDDQARLKVACKMYELRFGEKPPERRSVEQLRGIEGARVKKTYENMAKCYRVKWKGRRYDPAQWDASDTPTSASRPPPLVCTASPKRPYSPPATHPPSASPTPANPYPSSTTSRTS